MTEKLIWAVDPGVEFANPENLIDAATAEGWRVTINHDEGGVSVSIYLAHDRRPSCWARFTITGGSFNPATLAEVTGGVWVPPAFRSVRQFVAPYAQAAELPKNEVKRVVHEHELNPGLMDRQYDIPNFQKGVKVVQDFIVTPGSHGAKKFDDGKIRYELLPGQALEDIAHVFTFGAVKYGDFNWMDGLTSLRLFGALCRHAYAWSRGETLDKESGLHHLAHAAACCMMLVEQQDRKDLDDRVSMRKVQKVAAPQFHGSEG